MQHVNWFKKFSCVVSYSVGVQEFMRVTAQGKKLSLWRVVLVNAKHRPEGSSITNRNKSIFVNLY